MLKKIFFQVLFISLLVPSLVQAAPAYGPRMPAQKEFHVGLQTHSVFKRYLEKEYGELRSWQHFLLLSYGLADWFSLDLKGGAGYIKQHPHVSDEVDYPTFMAGGYGFRIKLYEQERTAAVFGFQHISVHPYTVEINNVKNKAVLDDWQFSLLGAYKREGWDVYLGTRWSRLDYIHWVDDQRKLKKSDLTKSVGLFVGGDFFFNEKVWMNIEGQFLDSSAVAFSLNYRF